MGSDCIYMSEIIVDRIYYKIDNDSYLKLLDESGLINTNNFYLKQRLLLIYTTGITYKKFYKCILFTDQQIMEEYNLYKNVKLFIMNKIINKLKTIKMDVD